MQVLGTYALGATVRGEFAVALASGARGDPSSVLEVSDLVLYKNGVATERTSTAGYGVTSTFDAKTGLVTWSVDMSDNTDAGFFLTPGDEYALALYPDETVDALLVSKWLAKWDTGRRSAQTPVIGLAQGGAVGYVDLPAAASSVNNAYKGAMVTVQHASGAIESRFQSATAYVGATRRLSVDPDFDTAPAATAAVWLLTLPPAPAANVPVVTVSSTSLTAIRNAILNWEPFTGYSLAKLFRVLGIIFGGTKSGGNTATETYTAPAGGATVVSDVESDSDRTTNTTTASGTP